MSFLLLLYATSIQVEIDNVLLNNSAQFNRLCVETWDLKLWIKIKNLVLNSSWKEVE